MKFQFNKTAMQRLRRELQIRQRALPTLKAKETALRLEVRQAKDALEELEEELNKFKQSRAHFAGLWLEFPDVLSLADIEIEMRNIAGVRVPELKEACFQKLDFSYYLQRAWIPGGVALLEQLCTLTIQVRLLHRSVAILNQARKKTTQKVNLYEKVQIPEYQAALLKIKRFLEDQENLSRAAQKIVKERNRLKEATAP